jgi:hypothetical protein
LPKGRRACIWCPLAEICYSPVPRYELVQRSSVGGDELLCTTWLLRMSESIWFLWANKLHHMRERVLLHSLITRYRHRGLRSSLCVRRFETPQCINCCRMIWWSTYGGFEATPTSFRLICLKTCQIICLFFVL